MPPAIVRALRIAATAVAASILGLGAVGALYEPNTVIPAGAAGTQVKVRDFPLRVVQSGSGRDVLLIHGSPGSVEDWEPIIRGLSDSFHVTAFDWPGQGYSGDTGEYSIEHNADVALELVDALKLDHVIVVGHSFGGATALAMALRTSPRVDAYVIIDSAAYTPSRKAGMLFRVLDAPGVGRGLSAVVAPLFAPAKIRKGLAETFSNGTVPEEFATRRIAIWNSPKVSHATAAETLGYAGWLRVLSPGYPRIARPVVIVAEADSEFRRTTAERLHQDIAGSTLRLVPGTGHLIQIEKPDAVVDAIRQAAGQKG